MTANANYVAEGHRLRVEDPKNPDAWIESQLTVGDLMYLKQVGNK